VTGRGLALLSLLLLGLAPRGTALDVPGSDATLLLVGDAGASDPRGEPVLQAVSREAARDPSHTTIVFLGDNAYPRGLPGEADPSRPEAARRLQSQIDAARESGARAVFIPGNHDWAEQGSDGWNAVRRQVAFVNERGGPGISFRPEGGCPGPDVVDLGATLRLIILDTQWFLHGGPKPTEPTSSCPCDSEAEVVAALRADLASAGQRRVLVAAHHPLATGGAHGGHFSWQEHVFPLRALRSWLWVPLPVIGSAYPLARQSGITPQDLPSAAYRRMRDSLQQAVQGQRVLAWLSGHDHSLQVLATGNPAFQLVSGAGVFARATSVARLPQTRFASTDAGFMRLVSRADGSIGLTVLTVDKTGAAQQRYALELEAAPR
jgi:hypothetical protein